MIFLFQSSFWKNAIILKTLVQFQKQAVRSLESNSNFVSNISDPTDFPVGGSFMTLVIEMIFGR